MNTTIKSIQKIKHSSKRYDLQTKTHHNFFANGILVHNSIIKVWHHDGSWHISTNGMIDAFETDLMNPTEGAASFGELFQLAAANTCGGYSALLNMLDPRYTWIFELTSPWNRVVVPYADTTITHIGTRNNTTLLEEEIDIGIKKPELHSFSSWDQMVATAATLPFSQEGYVVVDADWKRVKVKSLAYVQAHHLKDNGNVNPNRVLCLIKANEQEEFLQYFPEYTEHFKRIEKKYQATMDAISLIRQEVQDLKTTCATRKDFALEVQKKNSKIRKYYFTCFDGNEERLTSQISSLEYDDLL